MRIAVITALSALTLAGCSSSQADLNAKTPEISRSYAANYQQTYRNLYTTATRCQETGVLYGGQLAVDGELYSDLGFGEISFSSSGSGLRNYYWTAKIERDGKGSKVTAHVGNSLVNDKYLANIFAWAGGSTEC